MVLYQRVRDFVSPVFFSIQDNKLKFGIHLGVALIVALLLSLVLGQSFDGSAIRLRGEPRKVRDAPKVAASIGGGDDELKDPFANRPRIRTKNGHLVIEASQDKNIDFKTSGSRGTVTINGLSLDQLMNVTRALERSASLMAATTSSTSGGGDQYEQLLNVMLGSSKRLVDVEKLADSLKVKVEELEKQMGKVQRRLQKRLQILAALMRDQEAMANKLKRNECFDAETGQPVCKNGATCVNTYGGFKCLCSVQFEGLTCEQDVDECAKFRGTDLGCQNGAKCVNLVGGYRCECGNQFHGIHCTEQHDDCALSSSRSLCGQGKCLNLARTEPNQARYECLCDQGWTTDGTNPACVVDVNECAVVESNISSSSSSSTHLAAYPCSQSPFVDCTNLPGSFQCGPCPPGYTGNGRLCRDLDECQLGLATCSRNPLVECINTQGGYRCAPCPPGYTGDGFQCSPLGVCNRDQNGGCHPMAKCLPLNGLGAGARLCTCQYPYAGDGEGPSGCKLAPGAVRPAQSPAANQSSTSYSRDDCQPNPCQNGANCLGTASGFECICLPGSSGRLCDEKAPNCGGFFATSRGSLAFPPAAVASVGALVQRPQLTNNSLLSCNFTLSVESNMSIQLSVANFSSQVQLFLLNSTANQRRGPPSCPEQVNVYERLYLEPNNSKDPQQDRLVARFCSTISPIKQGASLVDTHKPVQLEVEANTAIIEYSLRNYLSHAAERPLNFRANWTKKEPTCGRVLPVLSAQGTGLLKSPNFPEFYPAGAECRYLLRVPPGKRMRIQLNELNLLANLHDRNDCSDSLTILDGAVGSDRPLLFRHCANKPDRWSSRASLSPPAPIVSSNSKVELILSSRQDSQASVELGGLSKTAKGFSLTYTVEASAGCGGLFTGQSDTISSYDFVPASQPQQPPADEARLPWQTWRLFNPEPWTNNLNQKASATSDSHLAILGLYDGSTGGPRTSKSDSNSNNNNNNRTRCEYEIRLEQGQANQKLLIDWLEMPGDPRPDYFGKWSRRIRCLRSNLRLFDGNPLENRTELANFCSGDKYDANAPELTPIASTGRLLYLVYETTTAQEPSTASGEPLAGGFRLHYSTICTAVYSQLSGRIEAQVDAGLSECIYHIVLPPNNTISLVIEAKDSQDSMTLLGGSCAAEVIFMDGAIQSSPGKQWLASAERELKRFNFNKNDPGTSSPPTTTSASSSSSNEISRVGSELGQQQQQDNYYWQYSSSQAHDIKEFKVCQLPMLSFDSIWNHLSLLFRLNGQAVADPASTKPIRLTIKYQAEPSCGGIISEPSEGSIKLDSSRKIKSLSNFPLTVQKYEQLHRQQFVNPCAYILRAPQVNDVIQVTFTMPVKDIQRRYSEWVDWYRKQPWSRTQPSGGGGGGGDDELGAANSFNCSQVFYETIELYEPQLNSSRQLCPLDLATGQWSQQTNSNDSIIWLTQSNTVLIRLRNSTDLAATNSTLWPGRRPLDASKMQANYQFVPLRMGRRCGGRLFMDSGTLRSPRFPFIYPSFLHCDWVIQAANPRQQIRLNFTKFALEESNNCRDDYLELRNGPHLDSPLIGRFCGQQLQSKVLVGHSNLMRLTFVTDSHENHPGFEIYFDGAQTGCGGSLRTPSGQIDSPNYPYPYAHSSDCEWLIELPQANRIELKVESLDLSCQLNGTKSNYLAIFDSASSSSRALGKFCHIDELAKSSSRFVSSANKMLIVYKSQALDEGKGFRLTYRTLCEQVELVGIRGAIESPGYPAGYEPNMRCGWTIRAPLGSNLSLVLTDLQMELDRSFSVMVGGGGGGISNSANGTSKPRQACLSDYMEIIQLEDKTSATPNATKSNARARRQTPEVGRGKLAAPSWRSRANVELPPVVGPRLRPPNGRLVRTYCGLFEQLDEAERRLELNSNRVYVGFQSDHGLQMRGFRLEWEARGCGGAQVEGDSIERLTYHEADARGPIECLWSYELASSANSISFMLQSDMRAQGDGSGGGGRATAGDNCDDVSLTIYDGPSDQSPVLAKNCDALRNKEPVRTSGNMALVRFYSSGRHNFGRWFSLTGWPWLRENCLMSSYDIDAPFNKLAGELRSPGYPDQYDSIQYRCFAMLSARAGRLRFRLEELEVPLTEVGPVAVSLQSKEACRASDNYLVVRDLNGRSIDQHYCGRLSDSPEDQAKRTLVMDYEAAWVEFHSSRLGLRGRWRLSYSRLCGSLLQITHPLSFSTPDYPARPKWPRDSLEPKDSSESVCLWRLVPFSGDLQPAEGGGGGGPDKKLHLSIVNFIESDRDTTNDCLRIYEGANLTLRQSSFNLTRLDLELQPKVKLCKQSDIKHSSLHYVSQGAEVAVLVSGRAAVRMRAKPFENFCGGELQLNQAEFATLGYPQPYAPNLDCHYFIQASPGATIRLRFLDMDLPEAAPLSAPKSSTDADEAEDQELAALTATSESQQQQDSSVGAKCEAQDYIEIRQLAARNKVRARLGASGHWRGGMLFRWISQGLLVSRADATEWPATRNTSQTSEANLGNWTRSDSSETSAANTLMQLTRLYLLFHEGSTTTTGHRSRPLRSSLVLEDFYENSRLIGRFCGKQAPDLSALQLKDEILVRFRSHGSPQQTTAAAPRGFLASYKFEYGGLITMDKDKDKLGGFISSPEYPNKVKANETIRWTFLTTTDSVIKLELVSMDLGQVGRDCQDTLSIFSGAESRDEFRLSRLCGHLSFKILDMDNSLRTGASVSKILPVYLAHESEVRASLVQTVRSLGNTATVTYDNIRDEGSFLLKYSAEPARASQAPKTQYFPPDSAQVNDFPDEPDANLWSANISKGCSQTYRLELANSNSSQATLVSPDWPNRPRQMNIECQWLLYTLDNTNIQLSVLPPRNESLDYSLATTTTNIYQRQWNQRSDYCLSGSKEGRNYVIIHDGASRLAPTLGRHCLPVAPGLFQSTGRQMLVRFIYSQPDPNQPARSLFKASASVGQCGGQYHIISGVTISDRPPGRSKLYANNLDCTYQVFASNPDQVLTIQQDMSEFDLAKEPSNENCTVGDYIEILDLPIQNEQMEPVGGGGGQQKGRSLGRFCAGHKLEYIESPGSAISIQFKTDNANRAKGFQLFVMGTRPRMSCPRSYQSLNLDEPFGQLSSPNYPHGFYGRRHCRFHLVAPPQQSIELTFVRLRRPVSPLDQHTCLDNLTYLADNEANSLRFEPGPLRDLKAPVSGTQLRSLLKEIKCRDKLFGAETTTSAEQQLLQEPDIDVVRTEFKSISAEDYFRLRLMAPPMATQIRTDSHVLLLDYETKNLLPRQGFFAIYRLVENEPPKRCGGTVLYGGGEQQSLTNVQKFPSNASSIEHRGSSNLLESGNFGLISEQSDDYIQCDWNLMIESNGWDFTGDGRSSLGYNLVAQDQVPNFKTAYLVFETLEIPPLRTGATMLEIWAPDKVNKVLDTCGLNRLILSDQYYTQATIACGNITGSYKGNKWLPLDNNSRQVSLRTKNLKVGDTFYRGLRAYYYEKSCLQAERLVGEGLRLRSHSGYPAMNTSYLPGICKWDIRLTGGDYELWFDQINFRPPKNYNNNTGAKTSCDDDNDNLSDLDYLEIRGSADFDAPVLFRYCIYNQLANNQKALLLNMRSELSIVFVAGLGRLAKNKETFEYSKTNQTSVYGFSMQLVRTRNESVGEFCHRESKNNIMSFIRSKETGLYPEFAYFLGANSFASFLYPNNTHCVIHMSLDEGSRFNITFRGMFDMESSPDCSNDYIQIEDLLPPSSIASSNTTTSSAKVRTTVKPSANVAHVITRPNQLEAKKIGRWCGRTRPTGYYLSKGEKIRITFHSNDRVEGKGFLIEWSIVPPSNSTTSFAQLPWLQQALMSKRFPDLYI